jgi:lincosamide nucleotidyltransferase
MMTQPQLLLDRLDQIAQSLAQSDHALALIGLGSVGTELDRLDAFSDLDFFAIVEKTYKSRYIQHPDWLYNAHPIAYMFPNTADGYKLLFKDGIFCECAVFEPHELRAASFARGRIVWQRDDFDSALAEPQPQPVNQPPSREWLIGEALTNLYVGLGHYRRGEKLSAQRFIQQYAVERVVDLIARIETEASAHRDVFAGERRVEQRYPIETRHLPEFVQGYDRSPQSAAAILNWLEQHFDINVAMAQAIRQLIDR